MNDERKMRIKDLVEAFKSNLTYEDVLEAEAMAEGYVEGLKDGMSIGKWIPCEERLPEDKCDVLIQFGWNMAVGCIDGGDWRINSGDAWCTEVAEDDGKPIAWMPLPTEYRGE